MEIATLFSEKYNKTKTTKEKHMRVVRTLEYINNDELNKYLSSKLHYAKKMRIDVKIELTELIDDIFLDFDDYKYILDRAFRYAFRIINRINIKKLTFVMFYKNGYLYFVIVYPSLNKYGKIFYPLYVIERMEKGLEGYDNVYQSIKWEKGQIVHQIATGISNEEAVFY